MVCCTERQVSIAWIDRDYYSLCLIRAGYVFIRLRNIDHNMKRKKQNTCRAYTLKWHDTFASLQITIEYVVVLCYTRICACELDNTPWSCGKRSSLGVIVVTNFLDLSTISVYAMSYNLHCEEPVLPLHRCPFNVGWNERLTPCVIFNNTTPTMARDVLASLRWRHNGRDGIAITSRAFLFFLLNRSKKSSKLRLTGLCVGNSPLTTL